MSSLSTLREALAAAQAGAEADAVAAWSALEEAVKVLLRDPITLDHDDDGLLVLVDGCTIVVEHVLLGGEVSAVELGGVDCDLHGEMPGLYVVTRREDHIHPT